LKPGRNFLLHEIEDLGSLLRIKQLQDPYGITAPENGPSETVRVYVLSALNQSLAGIAWDW
jgi:hypothetical protein